ncbi:MAG: hypothetical protein JKY65_08200 [Planctomycetes bacterium]|nr:hypothetical protein [Planctomycetota bacterium]
MSSPYDPPADLGRESSHLPPPQVPGLVGHVRVLSALMMAQGLLDLLAALGLTATGLFMKFGMADAMAQNPQLQQGGALPPGFMQMMTWTYVGMGVVVGLIGMLHVYAGVRSWQYRERNLGIVSLVVGLGTILTCYCAPTSMLLFVYGLAVYLNPSVNHAFQLGDKGISADEITLTFSRILYEKSFKD